MPVDYSKFEGIVDSDEEAEPTKTTAPTKTKAAPTKCAGCGATDKKLKACTACKKVAYCSPTCQRSDWKFHRRTCGSASDSTSASSTTPRKPRGPRPPKKKEPDSDDDDDDDGPLDWYRHRETKLPPSATGPEKLANEDAASAARASNNGADTKPPPPGASSSSSSCTTTTTSALSSASAWNAAGSAAESYRTWEERDVLKWVRERADACLGAVTWPASAPRCVASKIECEGDASIGVVRGTPRRLMDVTLKVHVDVRVDDTSYRATLKVVDVTHESVAEPVDVALDGFADEKLVKKDGAAGDVRAALLGAPSRSALAVPPSDQAPAPCFAHVLVAAIRTDLLPAFFEL